jgi:hypothetical protein
MRLQARESDDALSAWVRCGGEATLSSYSPHGDRRGLADIPASDWQFIEEETRAWFETGTHPAPAA